MDPSIKKEVINQNEFLLSTLPKVDEIKKEVPDEDLSSKFVKYDDYSFESFHENVFRSLSENFDNASNIDQVNEAFEKLEKCFIQNNILNKSGLSKISLRDPVSKSVFFKYRDIDDAFENMVITDSSTKPGNFSHPIEIDLKPFKEFFSVNSEESHLSDNEESASRHNDPDSEEIDPLIDGYNTENDYSDFEITNGDEIGDDSSLVENNDFLGDGFTSTSERSGPDDLSDKLSNAEAVNDNIYSPLKDTVRDVRVIIKKLGNKEIENTIDFEEQTNPIPFQEIYYHPNPSSKGIRQVARKKTGGVVINDINQDTNKEDKIIQQLSSKDGDFVPSVFDKMTRAGKRDLERVIAESTANLVIQKTSQLIYEKIKELPSNDKDSESSSDEDEDKDSDIHKTAEIVTNTIIQFLAKSRGKKMEKLGKDITDEITNKVKNLKVSNIAEEDVPVNDQDSSHRLYSPTIDKVEKIENKMVKSADKEEENNLITRETQGNAQKRKSMKKGSANKTRKTLADQFEELARIEKDIISCELTTPLAKVNFEELLRNNEIIEESRRPETRLSKQKLNDMNILKNDENIEEPRRPETRQSKQKQHSELSNSLVIDEIIEEPRRPETRQSKQKLCGLSNSLMSDEKVEPRRPETRQSKQKLSELSNSLINDASGQGPTQPETSKSMEKPVNTPLLMAEIIAEPRRPNTRQSKKEIMKVTSQSNQITAEVRRTAAPKRRSSSRLKKSKQPRNISDAGNALSNESLIDGHLLIDLDSSEDSSVNINDSEFRKALKNPCTSSFVDRIILKANADSTTSEIGLLANEISDIDSTNIDKQFSKENEAAVTSGDIKGNNIAISGIHIDKEHETLDNHEDIPCEGNSLKGNLKESSLNLQCDVQNIVSENEEKVNQSTLEYGKSSNELTAIENKENLNLSPRKVKNPSDLDLTKENLNTSQDCLEIDKSNTNSVHKNFSRDTSLDFNEVVSPPKNESLHVLNNVITDVENKAKASYENRKVNDIFLTPINNSKEQSPRNNLEVSADSTSFLNFSMEDDSFRLMIDEGTPQKEHNKVEEENCRKLNTFEGAMNLLLCDSNKSKFEHLDESLTKENVIKERNIVETVEVDNLHENLERDRITDENATRNQFVENKSNDSREHSSSESLNESKPVTFNKILSNEEKIAQLTKRDPRLAQEKKMVNVLRRDPRMRNKLPKIEEIKQRPLELKLPEPMISDLKTTEQESPVAIPTEQPSTKIKPAEPKSSTEKPPEDISLSVMTPEPKVSKQSTSEPLILDKPQSSGSESVHQESSEMNQIAAFVGPENCEKASESGPSQYSAKVDLLDGNIDLARRKKPKKIVDEELLYKTPLSDLHESHSDQPTYDRILKKKRTLPPANNNREMIEESRTSVQRRVRIYEEIIDERVFRRPQEDQISEGYYPHEAYKVRSATSMEGEQLEEQFGRSYDDRRFRQEERQDFQPELGATYGQDGGYARRVRVENNFGDFRERNDFSDNHIYSRREFFRRNKYAHDHDHFGSSSRLMDIHQETPPYSEQNNFAASSDSVFRISAYPAVSMLPEPMYSQEEEFDQNYGNMETDSFSPPSSDLCPPPPLIRSPSPTPESARRDSYCPSPPRIRDSPEGRGYEEFNRAFRSNYEMDGRSYRGRNSFLRDNGNNRHRGGYYRRGSGRDIHWKERSPPRKRFAREHVRGRDDKIAGRWRRSPSWSPERAQHRTRKVSLSPEEPRPWESPRSPSPPRRHDNYRDRGRPYKYYNRYP